jgi:hypothetical protein
MAYDWELWRDILMDWFLAGSCLSMDSRKGHSSCERQREEILALFGLSRIQL